MKMLNQTIMKKVSFGSFVKYKLALSQLHIKIYCIIILRILCTVLFSTFYTGSLEIMKKIKRHPEQSGSKNYLYEKRKLHLGLFNFGESYIRGAIINKFKGIYL